MSAIAPLPRPLPGMFFPDPETPALGCAVLALGVDRDAFAIVVTASGQLERVDLDHVDVLDETLRLLAENGAADHARRMALVAPR